MANKKYLTKNTLTSAKSKNRYSGVELNISNNKDGVWLLNGKSYDECSYNQKKIFDLFIKEIKIQMQTNDLFEILNAIKEVLRVDLTKEHGKGNHLFDARMIYCLLARKHTESTLAEIGEPINKSHSSVINAIEKANQYKEIYSDFDYKISKVYEQINK